MPDVGLQIVEAIDAALGGAPPVVVASVIDAGTSDTVTAGEKLLLHVDGQTLGGFAEPALQEVVLAAAHDALDAFPRVMVQTMYFGRDGAAVTRRHQARPGDAQIMLQLFESAAKLLIVGAGHIGLAVAEMGEMLGYHITVVDDREEFANAERFPMAEHVCCGAIDEELDALPIDRSTFAVLVSRGHKQDEIALRHVLGRGAGYIGMVGSKRRTATVLGHLLDEGFDHDELEAVATPIGLDIHSETPAEIAVSIVAEVTLIRRGGTGHRMSEGRAKLTAIPSPNGSRSTA